MVGSTLAQIWLPLHGIGVFRSFETVTCFLIGIGLGRRLPGGILLFRKQAARKIDDASYLLETETKYPIGAGYMFATAADFELSGSRER